ncbi:hypothetical protein Sjap_018420 [Stephania japonica]|uniref:Uncharacterized protein n=1 Tax=Stephania japonica TaxID=461633 RepID=A0AAP0I808_9MAGN
MVRRQHGRIKAMAILEKIDFRCENVMYKASLMMPMKPIRRNLFASDLSMILFV